MFLTKTLALDLLLIFLLIVYFNIFSFLDKQVKE